MAISSFKEKVSHGLDSVKSQGKKALATLATVTALSGALTSCDNADIHVDLGEHSVSTEITFANNQEADLFDVKVQKVWDSCRAEIDGPLLENEEFFGTKEEVFTQLEDYFYSRALRRSMAPEDTPNWQLAQKVSDKFAALKESYDKMEAKKPIYNISVDK